MYSVMIVDDEPTIREGLKALIEWESLGFAVADTAGSAKEAVAKYRLHKPDVLVVDIRMPGMNGLELVQLLKRDNDRLHILVLSGYADFSYAKTAISLGVDGYLLKPVDEEEMTDYLKKLKTALDDERRSRAAEEGEAWSRERLVQAILADRVAGGGEALYRAAADAELLWSVYEIVLLLPQPCDSDTQPASGALLAGLISLYERSGRGVVFPADPYIGILLRDGLSGAPAQRRLLADLQKAAEAEKCSFVVAAGGQVQKLAEIGGSYATALERMRQRFFYGPEEMIGPEPPPHLPGRTPDREALNRLEGMGDKLALAAESGNPDAAGRLLEEAGRLMLQAGEGETGIKTRFVHMLTHVLNRLAHTQASVRERANEYAGRVLALERSATYAALLQSSAALLADAAAATGGDTQENRIRRMIDLIQRNYKENLKLETIAEALSYNSAYLGKLFKSHTGDYFNTYLDKVRIEKAKELLDQGMRVYEVAEQVGFANVDYFHTKFRKYVGMSPTQYRKK